MVQELDRIGNICFVPTFTDASPFTDFDIPSRRYMENIKTVNRLLFPHEDTETKSSLSSRGLKVIGPVSQGFQSREIVDYPDISVSTVNNHRQYILAKTQSADTAEATG